MDRTGRTGQCELFGPFFHFWCGIHYIHTVHFLDWYNNCHWAEHPVLCDCQLCRRHEWHPRLHRKHDRGGQFGIRQQWHAHHCQGKCSAASCTLPQDLLSFFGLEKGFKIIPKTKKVIYIFTLVPTLLWPPHTAPEEDLGSRSYFGFQSKFQQNMFVSKGC